MRLDLYLVTQLLTPTRSKAQQLIKAGQVEVQKKGSWMVVKSSSFMIEPQTAVRLLNADVIRFVSRAGLKLQGALEAVELSIEGFDALDIGQSTGGFTDCLLQNGARQVVGVDVGCDQLDSKIKNHPNVVWFEKINARTLSDAQEMQSYLEKKFDLVVIDVSFISLEHILSQAYKFLSVGGHLVSLVKPQFELGKKDLNKNGIVKDPEKYRLVESHVKQWACECGFKVINYFASSIDGGDGNKEFFIYAEK